MGSRFQLCSRGVTPPRAVGCTGGEAVPRVQNTEHKGVTVSGPWGQRTVQVVHDALPTFDYQCTGVCAARHSLCLPSSDRWTLPMSSTWSQHSHN